jgi:DNA-binding CsgD family transcriptional regulator
VNGRNGGIGLELTDTERRLLPLLTTTLSLTEIGQILEVPPEAVLALSQSIYAKLGLRGEDGPRLTGL